MWSLPPHVPQPSRQESCPPAYWDSKTDARIPPSQTPPSVVSLTAATLRRMQYWGGWGWAQLRVVGHVSTRAPPADLSSPPPPFGGPEQGTLTHFVDPGMADVLHMGSEGGAERPVREERHAVTRPPFEEVFGAVWTSWGGFYVSAGGGSFHPGKAVGPPAPAPTLPIRDASLWSYTRCRLGPSTRRTWTHSRFTPK